MSREPVNNPKLAQEIVHWLKPHFREITTDNVKIEQEHYQTNEEEQESIRRLRSNYGRSATPGFKTHVTFPGIALDIDDMKEVRDQLSGTNIHTTWNKTSVSFCAPVGQVMHAMGVEPDVPQQVNTQQIKQG